MLRQLAVVLAFLIVSVSLYAQTDTEEDVVADSTSVSAQTEQQETAEKDTTPSPPAVLRYDSTDVSVRSAEQGLKKFRDDKDFIYEDRGASDPTLIEQFIEWLLSLLGILSPSSSPAMRAFWRAFPYIIIGVALVFVVFRMTNTSFGGLFGRTARRVVDTEMLEENIHELDFEKLIDDAVSAEQYRKAIRLLYLRALKELSDGNYIRWSPERTNREYLAELPSGDMRRNFEQLTLLFEYIWYGDFPVDKLLFEQSRQLFRDFSTMTTVQHV